MGAALAQIAAFEIRRLGKEHGRDKKITCITFGGPRTGNHAFAAEYNVRSRPAVSPSDPPSTVLWT